MGGQDWWCRWAGLEVWVGRTGGVGGRTGGVGGQDWRCRWAGLEV